LTPVSHEPATPVGSWGAASARKAPVELFRAEERDLTALDATERQVYARHMKPLRWWAPVVIAAIAVMFGILPYAPLSSAGKMPVSEHAR
jgi:hypothetical protein